MTVTTPVVVWIVPITGGGGAAIAWAQPPTTPSSPGTSQLPRNTLLSLCFGVPRDESLYRFFKTCARAIFQPTKPHVERDTKSAASLHLVGASEQRRWHFEA